MRLRRTGRLLALVLCAAVVATTLKTGASSASALAASFARIAADLGAIPVLGDGAAGELPSASLREGERADWAEPGPAGGGGGAAAPVAADHPAGSALRHSGFARAEADPRPPLDLAARAPTGPPVAGG